MNSLTFTKTGRVELDAPIKASAISLKSITLFQTMYNLTEETEYTPPNKPKVKIPPGYYTYSQIREKLGDTFQVDENTLEVSFDESLKGGLSKLIKDKLLYLTPLCLYLYVDGIDASKNLLNGKRSDLLSIIPVGKTEFAQIYKYQPIENYKLMYQGEIGSLNISLTDERGNEYKGKLALEIVIK